MIDPSLLVPPPGYCRCGVLRGDTAVYTLVISPSDRANQYFITYYRGGFVLRVVAGSHRPIFANELAEMLQAMTDVDGWNRADWETLPYEGPLDRNIWLAEGAHLLFDQIQHKKTRPKTVIFN